MIRAKIKRGNNVKTILKHSHIESKINIKLSSNCITCPYRIYADEAEIVTLGIGNIHSNFIFVLPTYDTKTTMGYDNLLDLLCKSYNDIKSLDLLEEVYVTRLVKCSKNTEYNLYGSAIHSCSKYLIYELNRLSAKNIVFFGTAYNDYINNNDTAGTFIPNKNIFSSYSPGILLHDNEITKVHFIQHLSNILANN